MKLLLGCMIFMPLLSFGRLIYFESGIKGKVSIGLITSNCQTFTQELLSYAVASLEVGDDCAIQKIKAVINSGVFAGQVLEYMLVTDPYGSYKVVIVPAALHTNAAMNVIPQ